MVQMIKALYEDFQCSVIDEGVTTEWFSVMTGVKQGCCMSGFLFLLAIDWVMRRTTVGERTGIRWDFTTMLEDLDLADDLALLLSAMNHLQQKTSRLEVNAAKVGLKLNDKKCKVMKANSRSDEKLRGNEVEEVESFIYLGANVTKDGGGAVDVRRRITQASARFKRISNIWRASDIRRKTKVSLFKSLVLSVLLYGCETWKLTKGEEEKLDTFQNKCLRKVLKVRWQQHISNATDLEATEMDRVSEEVRRKRWSWIGHILR